MKEYTLTIKTKYWGHKLTNKNPKKLRKVYFWYILRESKIYNVVHKTGMYVVQRDEVKEMSLEFQDVVELPSAVDLPVEKSLFKRIKSLI